MFNTYSTPHSVHLNSEVERYTQETDFTQRREGWLTDAQKIRSQFRPLNFKSLLNGYEP